MSEGVRSGLSTGVRCGDSLGLRVPCCQPPPPPECEKNSATRCFNDGQGTGTIARTVKLTIADATTIYGGCRTDTQVLSRLDGGSANRVYYLSSNGTSIYNFIGSFMAAGHSSGASAPSGVQFGGGATGNECTGDEFTWWRIPSFIQLAAGNDDPSGSTEQIIDLGMFPSDLLDASNQPAAGGFAPWLWLMDGQISGSGGESIGGITYPIAGSFCDQVSVIEGVSNDPFGRVLFGDGSMTVEFCPPCAVHCDGDKCASVAVTGTDHWGVNGNYEFIGRFQWGDAGSLGDIPTEFLDPAGNLVGSIESGSIVPIPAGCWWYFRSEDGQRCVGIWFDGVDYQSIVGKIIAPNAAFSIFYSTFNGAALTCDETANALRGSIDVAGSYDDGGTVFSRATVTLGVDCTPVDICANEGSDDCANTVHVSVTGGFFDGLETDITRTDTGTHDWGDSSAHYPFGGAYIQCIAGVLTLTLRSDDAGPCTIIYTADGTGACPTGRTWTLQSANEGCDPPTSVSVT